ncbi:MAG TPA: hypothetical protein VL832_11145, partial [Puia sp.]|nr:hypothetical protein [Puia sp.]
LADNEVYAKGVVTSHFDTILGELINALCRSHDSRGMISNETRVSEVSTKITHLGAGLLLTSVLTGQTIFKKLKRPVK